MLFIILNVKQLIRQLVVAPLVVKTAKSMYLIFYYSSSCTVAHIHMVVHRFRAQEELSFALAHFVLLIVYDIGGAHQILHIKAYVE